MITILYGGVVVMVVVVVVGEGGGPNNKLKKCIVYNYSNFYIF